MLDQETLRPVIIAMALYLALSKIVPELLKKPTNIKFIDDIIPGLYNLKKSIDLIKKQKTVKESKLLRLSL